jgi:hypothetical protein
MPFFYSNPEKAKNIYENLIDCLFKFACGPSDDWRRREEVERALELADQLTHEQDRIYREAKEQHKKRSAPVVALVQPTENPDEK